MDIGQSRYAATDQTVSDKGNFATFESRHRTYKLEDLDTVMLSRRASIVHETLIEIFMIAVQVTTAAAYLFGAGIVLDVFEFSLGFTAIFPAEWELWVSVGFFTVGTILALIGALRAVQLVRTRLTVASGTLKELENIAGTLAHRRMVYPGNDQISFGLGEEGLQIRGRNRVLQFGWKGFDFSCLKEVNPDIAQLLTDDNLPSYPFFDVEAGEFDDTSLRAFLSAARAWASETKPYPPHHLAHKSLRLPLSVSKESLEAARNEEEEAQRTQIYEKAISAGASKDRARKKAASVKVEVSNVKWREYIHIPAHFFMDGDELGDWPNAVALILYMLHRRADR